MTDKRWRLVLIVGVVIALLAIAAILLSQRGATRSASPTDTTARIIAERESAAPLGGGIR